MFTSTEKIQAKLPALNIKGIVPIPNNEIRLDIESPAALKALKEAESYWENKKNKKNKTPIYETIVNGEIEVIEIIKTY